MPSWFRVPFDAGTRKNLIALIVISLVVVALEHLGWLSSFENTALDTFLLAGRSKPSNNVFLIEITDDDFREVFRGKSPLDAAEVRQILSLIERARPKVIGVDLDTSSSDYREGDWPRAVWVRDATPICDEHKGEDEIGRESQCTDARSFLRLGYLGGRFTEAESSGSIETEPPSGLSLFPLDRDGVVRRYRSAYFSDRSDPPAPYKGLVDSFPRAVLRAFNTTRTSLTQAENDESRHPAAEAHASSGDGEEDLILNFSGDRYRFPRMSVKQLKQAGERPFWTTDSPLKGRIVLLGGAYRAARDTYLTPVGPRNGVEIAAQAIESELSGGGLRPINHRIALCIDLAAGLGLIWLNKRFHGRFMLLINALFIVLASLLGSYFSFHAVAYWFNFTAVLVSVWIHVLWEREAHFRESQEELKNSRDELNEVRSERDRGREEIGTLKAERDAFRTRCEAMLSGQETPAEVATTTSQDATGDGPPVSSEGTQVS
jgi:CHASE2 domain-containing sensor protein